MFENNEYSFHKIEAKWGIKMLLHFSLFLDKTGLSWSFGSFIY